jgi:hypothetical protein
VTVEQARAFIARHGVVLQSARGPVPSLADAIAGEPIRGSWWAHPKAHRIFDIIGAVIDSGDVLVCRLVNGKVTYVHRRLWSALVRMAERFPLERLAALREVHTPSGAHRIETTTFPRWVPRAVQRDAALLSEAAAVSALGDWLTLAPATVAAELSAPRRPRARSHARGPGRRSPKRRRVG